MGAYQTTLNYYLMMAENCLENILKLENKFSGRRGFIIATGPSLAYKDLSFLRDEITIGLNLSPLILDQWGIEPTFNLFADKYVIPRFSDVYNTLLKNTSTQKIIIASSCETFPEDLKDSNTYFILKKLPQEVIDFSENPIRDGFWRGKTVAYDALQFAYFLGLSEVYIIGMDMTFKHDWGKNGHAYEIQKNDKFPELIFPNSQSHMIQRGLPGKPEYRDLIIKYMQKAETHFKNSGRKVVNDIRSTIDIFEQEDILKKFGYIPRVVAFVPSKGTSNRVKNKNIRLLGDKPLFLHILDTLLSCYTIDEVYLDTESQEVFDLAKGRDHKELIRPVELASNRTDGNQLLLYEASQVTEADIYVQALPTAPFLSVDTIDKAVFALIKSREYDSVFAATRNKLYLWDESGKPINYDPQNIPNSFELPDTIIEAMSLYAIRREALLQKKTRIGERPYILPVPLIESIDINTEEDFKLVEIIYKGFKESSSNERL